MKFSVHQASHIGNRKYNQDRVAYAYSKDALLLVLADGMGGHLHGEVAASMAMDTFVESFAQHAQITDPQAFLSDTMRRAHERIMDLPQHKDQSFPGTTCVAALIQDGKMYWGHAGDSRLYLLRKGAVLSKTLDHSMVQMWLELGVIDEDEARTHPRRNQITNCLGGVEDLFEIALGQSVALQSGDVVLLCSDGLCGPFVDKELVSAFVGNPVDAALDKLIVVALKRENGKSDNVTGLAMRWGNSESLHDTDAIISHILDIQ
ncbi:MAG: protein phosphatase 2C domain-containing protein [Gallionella sp.]|nr:protein phosphatase 2C domain-containing protein [Gallionella sp.]